MALDWQQIASEYFAFGRHHLADRWRGYSEGARLGALNYAQKQFTRAAVGKVDFTQQKWQEAVCEQALFLLRDGRVAQQRGEKDAYTLQAQADASSAADGVELPSVGGISVEALRAIGWTGTVAFRG